MKFSLILRNGGFMIRRELKVFSKMTNGRDSKMAIHTIISINFINNNVSNKNISQICLVKLMFCSQIFRILDHFTNVRKSGLFISSTQNCKCVNKVKTSTLLWLKSYMASYKLHQWTVTPKKNSVNLSVPTTSLNFWYFKKILMTMENVIQVNSHGTQSQLLLQKRCKASLVLFHHKIMSNSHSETA